MIKRVAGCLLLLSGAGMSTPCRAAELFGPAAVSFHVGEFPDALAVADFDGGGALDLAVTNLGGNSLSILLVEDQLIREIGVG